VGGCGCGCGCGGGANAAGTKAAICTGAAMEHCKCWRCWWLTAPGFVRAISEQGASGQAGSAEMGTSSPACTAAGKPVHLRAPSRQSSKVGSPLYRGGIAPRGRGDRRASHCTHTTAHHTSHAHSAHTTARACRTPQCPSHGTRGTEARIG
jgi:hypothetical protein